MGNVEKDSAAEKLTFESGLKRDEMQATSVLTESGEVVALHEDYALVRVQAKNGCSGCSQSGGCGTSALSKLFVSRHSKPIKVLNRGGAKVGDTVDLSMDESRLVKHSFMAYGLPLIGLLVFSVLAQKLLSALGLSGEIPADLSAILGGAFGLLAGWWLTRRFYQPVLPEITQVHKTSQQMKELD